MKSRPSYSNISGLHLSDYVNHMFVNKVHLQVEPDEPTVVVENIEKKSRVKYVGGKVVSFLYAIGTGVTAAAGIATLASGPLFFVLAPILCLAAIYFNFRMTSNDVANIFVGGLKGLFQQKTVIETTLDVEDEEREAPMLPRKKAMMLWGGIFLSLSFGAVFGALTYGYTLTIASAFPILASVSFLLPPLGILLGVLTFISLSSLMTKAFSDLIKTENLKEKIIKTFKDIFYRDPVRDKNKSDFEFYVSRVFVGLIFGTLVVGTLGLIVIGQIAMLGNCAIEFGKVLTSITGVASPAITVISNIVGCGFALAAQIPFILKTSMTPIIKLFSKKDPSAVQPPAATTKEKLANLALYTAATLSAGATATIPLVGQTLGFAAFLSSLGAFLNSFLGGVVNATLSEPVGKKDVAVVKKTEIVSSTSDITKGLGKIPKPDLVVVTEQKPVAVFLPPKQIGIFTTAKAQLVANTTPEPMFPRCVSV